MKPSNTGSATVVHREGKLVLDQLRVQGIAAKKVKHNRSNDTYAVQFGAPEVARFECEGTDPAIVWARRIQDRFEGVEIIDTYDTVAEWRPQKPVLFATVFIRGTLTPKAS